MRTYDDAYEAAKPEPAFSNGTEGEAWMDNWCYRCLHDAVFQRTGNGPGCPIVGVALMGRTPVEWLEQPWGESGPSLSDRYHCTEFRPDDEDGGNSEPAPPPVLPGQLDLFTANALDGFEAELSREGVAVR